MRRSSKRQWGGEPLESKALLSGFRAAHVHTNPHASTIERPAAQVVATQASSTVGSSAGLNVGSALGTNDIQSLQQIASANNLRMFLGQLALLEDNTTSARQDAQALVNEGRDFDLSLHNLADSMGVGVPSDLMGADQTAAKNVLAAINTSMSFEQTYLSAIDQAEAELSAMLQQAATTAQNTSFQAVARTELPVVQARAATEKGLPTGSVAVNGAGAVTTPSSTTLNSQDVQTLEQSYSGTLLEHFLAQVTDLQTRNINVKLYADKLLNDHEQEAVQLGNYAAATGTALPANIQPSDVPPANQVLAAVNRRRYDTVYLRTMVQTHTKDLMSNQQTLATTQNPNLRQYAQDDVGTDSLHRLGARALLRGGR